jgi:hypothetical protein
LRLVRVEPADLLGGLADLRGGLADLRGGFICVGPADTESSFTARCPRVRVDMDTGFGW